MVKSNKSKGRKKVEMKPIENEEARQVCFSKRRQGLFKKASELSILCGATVGIVVFSITGRSFSFGHPSIDDVVNRFLSPAAPDGPASGGASHDNGGSVTDTVHNLNMEYLELEKSLESEMKRKERLQEEVEKEMGEQMMQWLNANILELGLEELREFQKKLEEIHGIVKEKVSKVLAEGRQTLGSFPQPHMEIASALQYQFGQQSAKPMSSTAASSSTAFIDGFEVNDPLLSGGGLGNIPNNQNHGDHCNLLICYE